MSSTLARHATRSFRSLDTLRWTPLPLLEHDAADGGAPQPRFLQRAAAIRLHGGEGSLVYLLFGGSLSDPRFRGVRNFSDTWLAEPLTGRVRLLAARGAQPSARTAFSLSSVEHREVWLFGGFSPQGVGFTCDMWRARLGDERTVEWHQLATPADASDEDLLSLEWPRPRQGHSMTWLRALGRLVLFGGSFPNDAFNDCWVFDTTSHSWSERTARIAGRAPDKRAGHSAAAARDGTALIVFGGNTTDSTLAPDVWLLDASCAEQLRWERVAVCGAPPSSRIGHSADMLGARPD